MSLLDKFDFQAVKELCRADLPVPVDVLNLIHFKDEEAYKWYGVLTVPLLKAVGAEVGWMGIHAKVFLGEPRADELLVVRYPNQRRFFALALNPYYIAVANPQRLKAVRKFEASFTHSPDSLLALRGSKWVLVVHCHEDSDAIQSIVQTAGGRLVYQSHETSPITITKRPHPADTNPLVFKSTYMFRFEDARSCDAAMQPGVLSQIHEAADEVSVQLYQRVPKRDALPAPLRRWMR
ncbi:MAG: hypothetical protein WCE62_07830 [Polyangiales bacterium]